MAGGVTIAIEKALWLDWAQIAIRHEADAREARARASTLSLPGGQDLIDEMHAGMVAIVAAASALEALYHSAGPDVIPAEYQRGAGKSRPSKASDRLQTLVAGFAGSRPIVGPHDLPALFGDRGSAVHPVPNLAPAVKHPLGTGVAREVVRYGFEAAVRAVDIMQAVLSASIAEDAEPRAQAWAAQHRRITTATLALRA